MTAAKYTIQTHLRHLKMAIAKLERYKEITDRKKFLSDEIMQDAIRKALEEALEIMLTIGNMIIAENNFQKPEINDDIFDILAENKVYPKDLARELWGAGGFRNILVHNYVKLDLELVYENLEKGIPIFKKYARAIAKFIK